MTTYHSPTSDTEPDTAPHWVPAPPPWESVEEPAWAPPAGVVDPWAPGPPGGWQVPPAGVWGWQPPPSSPNPPPAGPGQGDKPDQGRIAILIVAMLFAALVGAGIGSRIHRTTSALPASSTPAANAPGSGGLTPSSPPASSSSSAGTGAAAQASAIAAKVDPAIVDINTQLGYQNGAGAGTGMILTSTGEVLTNNHVIDGATNISVTVVATGKTYPATVVGTDRTEDIAVIQIKASGLKTIQTSGSVAAGDPIVAIGNAGGVGGTPAVVTGNVQAVGQTITAADMGGANAETLNGLIQIDAPIQPGDSGGPLVNTSGQVVGIDTAASSSGRFRNGATVGFAIPIDHALSIAHEIEAGHASSTIHIGLTGFIGVSISPSTTGSGALVSGVQSGSPAAGAGLVAGDTITSINGQTVDSSTSLSTLTKVHHPGDKVSVGWTTASGAGRSATVTLATGPAD